MAHRALILGNDDVTSGAEIDVVFTIPAGVAAGDVMLCVPVQNTGSNTFTITGGNVAGGSWTVESGPDTNNTNHRTYLFSATATSTTAGSTVTVSSTAGGRFVGVILVRFGVTRIGMVIPAVTIVLDGSASSSLVFPTATVPGAGWDVVGIGSMRVASTTPPSITGTPAGTTLHGSANTAIATSPNYCVAAASLDTPPAAGSRSIGTLTANTNVSQHLYTIALPPAGTSYAPSAADSVGITDSVSVSLTSSYSVTVGDSIGITDNVSAILGANQSTAAADTIGIADGIVVQLTRAPVRPGWTAFARDSGYRLGLPLPISSLDLVQRHLGAPTALLTTGYTWERWQALQPGQGLELWRNGRQEFTGAVTAVERALDDAGGTSIKVQATGDWARIARRLVHPDPARASDDQVINSYWSNTLKASTALRLLVSDQAGPTALNVTGRRIGALSLAADPNVGVVKKWQDAWVLVGDFADTIAKASGADLGVRVTAVNGGLVFAVAVPRDLTGTVRFSVPLRNLVGFTERYEAPTVTHAVGAGAGDLTARVRRLLTTTDPADTAWAWEGWEYVDRSDTADLAELDTAAGDAVIAGKAVKQVQVTLRDNDAATYGRDWELGDKVTAYVGIDGDPQFTTITDVVREIKFTVDATGLERITPAIGTPDATTAPRPTATLPRLVTAVVTRLKPRR